MKFAIALLSVTLIVSCSNSTVMSNGASFEDGIKALQENNFGLARQILIPIAEAGNPDAQFALAIMYKEKTFDESEMVRWLEIAAKNNHRLAQELFATTYAGGIGHEINTVKAEFWYCSAFHNGQESAGYALGRMAAATFYSLERRKYFSQDGYKHKFCNLEQLLELDPSLSEFSSSFAKSGQ